MVKNRKATVHIYIEGGGKGNLGAKLRKGFSVFFQKMKLDASPSIEVGGGRQQTFDKFQIAVEQGKKCLMLVDSEDLVSKNCKSAWLHFKNRKEDNWEKPDQADTDDAHLMVCCMESWFLADCEALKTFFGPDFKEKKLPQVKNSVETVEKDRVFDGLKQATQSCRPK